MRIWARKEKSKGIREVISDDDGVIKLVRNMDNT